jgi:hypothetical protein
MAIDRIPGVGPTNAEIAAAVAAPSAATIAAAVAAPSAATIASAVAAPSAATIAAAVAAPSSATIASAVAAAVPTTAGITSIVQANAGGQFSGTWTTVGFANHGVSASTGISVSGLSGYKYLRVITTGYSTSNPCNPMIRFNGDTGNNYMATAANGLSGNTATGVYHDQGFAYTNRTWLTGAGTQVNAGSPPMIDCIIPNSNSSAIKLITFVTMGYINSAGTRRSTQGAFSIYNSTSAISSIDFTHNGAFIDGGYTLILGGN